jgi:hypothetical protein
VTELTISPRVYQVFTTIGDSEGLPKPFIGGTGHRGQHFHCPQKWIKREICHAGEDRFLRELTSSVPTAQNNADRCFTDIPYLK